MKITYLLESADPKWGGVRTILDDANELSKRGHQVSIISKTRIPKDYPVYFSFKVVGDFSPISIPESDIVVGTFWTTVPFAYISQKGIPVHFCQGYEADYTDVEEIKKRIDEVYSICRMATITVSPHLDELLSRKFGIKSIVVPCGIEDIFFQEVNNGKPKDIPNIGLIGPYQITGKGIKLGIVAARIAHLAGFKFKFIRVSGSGFTREEIQLFPHAEFYTSIPYHKMPEVYRKLDCLLCTSQKEGEGFFLPAIEAMAGGVPCIMTDIPCHRSYGDLDYGIFVPRNSPEDMAKAMVELTMKKQLWRILSENSRKTALKFKMEEHFRLLQAAFLEISRGSNIKFCKYNSFT